MSQRRRREVGKPSASMILERLGHEEATVLEVARELRISFQAVSKHLQVLERAGLVEHERQLRPSRLRAAQSSARVNGLPRVFA
jgi:predicted transcriptional regulator